MKLLFSDSRVMEGTALQVVEEMRARAFVKSESVHAFIAWSVEKAREMVGIDLGVSLVGTEEEVAERYVRALLAAKLLEEVK